MPDAIGVILKLLLGAMAGVVALGIFTYGAAQLQGQDIKTYTEQQIEREGGLTSEAMSNIDDYIASSTRAKFVVESQSGNDAKPFGEATDFVIKGKAKVIGFELPLELTSFSGSAISKIR